MNFDVTAEDRFLNATIEKIVFEESKIKKTPMIVWHLIGEDGRRYWRRVGLIEAAKPIIRNDFQKIGQPLIEGLEKGMEKACGTECRIKLCIDGDTIIVGKPRKDVNNADTANV